MGNSDQRPRVELASLGMGSSIEHLTILTISLRYREKTETAEATGTETKPLLFDLARGLFDRLLPGMLTPTIELASCTTSFGTFNRPQAGYRVQVQLIRPGVVTRPGNGSGPSELEAYVAALIEALNNAVPNGVRETRV